MYLTEEVEVVVVVLVVVVVVEVVVAVVVEVVVKVIIIIIILTHCGRVTQICVFNTVNLGTSASSP